MCLITVVEVCRKHDQSVDSFVDFSQRHDVYLYLEYYAYYSLNPDLDLNAQPQKILMYH